MENHTSSTSQRCVAFFDFDGTLAKRDSLPLFLSRIVGPVKMTKNFAKAVLSPDRSLPDLKGAIKARWLALCLKGVSVKTAESALTGITPLWKTDVLEQLQTLKKEGATIVVATGALMLYIRTLLRDLPIDHIIATEMESLNGTLTGLMAGGNCVREEKARRVRAWLEQHGPFTKTIGYGNAPSDIPMLNLLDESHII